MTAEERRLLRSTAEAAERLRMAGRLSRTDSYYSKLYPVAVLSLLNDADETEIAQERIRLARVIAENLSRFVPDYGQFLLVAALGGNEAARSEVQAALRWVEEVRQLEIARAREDGS